MQQKTIWPLLSYTTHCKTSPANIASECEYCSVEISVCAFFPERLQIQVQCERICSERTIFGTTGGKYWIQPRVQKH